MALSVEERTIANRVQEWDRYLVPSNIFLLRKFFYLLFSNVHNTIYYMKKGRLS